jgi:hypothetical protein
MTDEQNLSGLLVVLTGGEKGKVFSVNGPMTMGRSEENEVTIDDHSVSRVHARIEPAGDKFTVTDLGSRNRIKLGKAKVRRCELSFGEEFCLGNVRMKILAPTPEERTAQQAIVSAPEGEMAVEVADQAPMDEFFEARGQHREKIRKALTLLGSLILGAAAVYAVAPFFQRKAPPHREDVVVYEGLSKAVAIGGGGRVLPASGYRVEDGSIADVAVDSGDGFIVKVTGKKSGITKAEGANTKGGKTIINIVVRIRADEKWVIDTYTDPQKRAYALSNIAAADDTESHNLYQAMKLLDLAAYALENVHPRPREYGRAATRANDLRNKIDTQFEELSKEYVLAYRARNMEGALQRLRRMKALVPDPEDYRNQRASLYLKRLERRLRRGG